MLQKPFVNLFQAWWTILNYQKQNCNDISEWQQSIHEGRKHLEILYKLQYPRKTMIEAEIVVFGGNYTKLLINMQNAIEHGSVLQLLTLPQPKLQKCSKTLSMHTRPHAHSQSHLVTNDDTCPHMHSWSHIITHTTSKILQHSLWLHICEWKTFRTGLHMCNDV